MQPTFRKTLIDLDKTLEQAKQTPLNWDKLDKIRTGVHAFFAELEERLGPEGKVLLAVPETRNLADAIALAELEAYIARHGIAQTLHDLQA